MSLCTALTKLECYNNILTDLQVRGCSSLATLKCHNNSLSALDLFVCSKLTEVNVANNKLTELNVNGRTALKSLDCSRNSLTGLNVDGCTALQALDCSGNKLSELTVSTCTALQRLSCYNNALTALPLTGNTALQVLWCENNQISALDLSRCTALYNLTCANNVLETLNVGGCTRLRSLSCGNNKLSALDVGNCSSLTNLSCSGQRVAGWMITEANDGSYQLNFSDYLTSAQLNRVNNVRGYDSSGAALSTSYQSGSAKFSTEPANICYNYNTGHSSVVMDITADGLGRGLSIKFVTEKLPDAIVGTPYYVELEATPGYANIIWNSVFSTAPGIVGDWPEIGPTTTLSGTPTTAGTYAVSVVVKIPGGNTIMKQLPLNVYEKPKITTTSLSNGMSGTSYNAALSAEGNALTWGQGSGSWPDWLSIDPETGKLSGTPDKDGTYEFTVQARNPVGVHASPLKVIVNAVKPNITTGYTLTPGTAGTPYSLKLNATGTAFIRWTKTSGELPNGLSLSYTTGTISGTPREAGTFYFSVKAENTAGSATSSFKLVINGVKPTISTVLSLPSGVVGEPYDVFLDATGTVPITWSASGLPSGLSCSSSGVIGGTPTAAGTYNVRLTATNSAGSDTTILTLVVDGGSSSSKPKITTDALPDATVGTDYGQRIYAYGSNITWDRSGSLPPGLTVLIGFFKNDDGESFASGYDIYGTPTSPGTYAFTLTATNQFGSDAKSFTINVGGVANTRPSIETSNLPNGKLKTWYSAALTASGTTPITWTKSGGTLPPGLALSTDGRITGTPSREGTFNFTVKATNSLGSDTKALTIAIGEKPTIGTTTATLPGALVGTSYSFTLAADGTKPITWSISGKPDWLTLAPSTGRLTGKPTAKDSHTFTVTAKNAMGSDTKELTLRVGEKPTITTNVLKTGVAGVYYEQMLSATGTEPITWSGTAPAGLTLASDGKLSGTIDKKGTYSFTAKATNEFGAVTKSLRVVIGEKPGIKPIDLKPAIVGTNYTATLTATGTTPITWKLKDGSALPKGLSLASNGRISGKPDASAERETAHTFTVIAENSTEIHDEKALELYVGKKPVITTLPADIPGGVVDEEYDPVQLEATGTLPITWSHTGKLPDRVSLSPDGILSGTPAKLGTYSFTAKAENRFGSVTKAFKIVVGQKPEIQTTSNELANAIVGVNYSVTLTATGTTPINWSLKEGSALPAGLTLAKNGRISGKPTEAASDGDHTFTVEATNSTSKVAEKALTITVGRKPTITTTELRGGVAGETITDTLKATGTEPITWDHNGKLPEGLTLDPDGTLHYEFAKKGTYSFTAKAWNDFGTVTKSLKIVIGEAPAITTTSLKPALVGTSYTATLTATGTTPITWTDDGRLPAGLTLASNGRISGKPTEKGEFTFSVTASNTTGKSDTERLTLVVNEKPTITTGTLPNGVVGEEYSFMLKAEGTDPITWAKASGTLPPDLELKADGELTGTPTKQGTYSFTVRAKNDHGNVTKALKLTIAPEGTDPDGTNEDTTSPDPDDASSEPGPDDPNDALDERMSLGEERDAASLAESLTEEELTLVSGDGRAIAAVLPEVTVTESGVYAFEVSLDQAVPVGAALVWCPFPRDVELASSDEIVTFLDVEGLEIGTIPEGHSVRVEPWLRADVTYAPVIAADVSAMDRSVSASSAASAEDGGGSSGGCSAGFGALALAGLATVALRPRKK